MLSQLQPGQKITDYFVLRHKEYRTKKGSTEPYLSVELGDASGRIFGSLWDKIDEVDPTLEPGRLLKIRATVIEWHGKNHLSIEKMRPVTEGDDVSLELFLPQSKKSSKELMKDFQSSVDLVQDSFLKKLLNMVIQDPAIFEKLPKAPAGKLWHHCYLGGLLEHTLNVVKVAQSIASHYENINGDLLTTGALLHDIGKIVEFKWDGFIDYSDAGRLHGHITIGYNLVANMITTIDGFPSNLRDELLHLILSHQGRREHGSPVEPMTREAMILSFADDIDSKLGAFERIYEKECEPGKKWSNYVKLMDRFLYFGDNCPQKF